jgi:hypothetical protein
LIDGVPVMRGREIMLHRGSFGAGALLALMVATGGAYGADEKYPNWKGQWFSDNQIIDGQLVLVFDPTKSFGPGQQAPLTPEYQNIRRCWKTAWPTRPRAASAIIPPRDACRAACRA